MNSNVYATQRGMSFDIGVSRLRPPLELMSGSRISPSFLRELPGGRFENLGSTRRAPGQSSQRHLGRPELAGGRRMYPVKADPARRIVITHKVVTSLNQEEADPYEGV